MEREIKDIITELKRIHIAEKHLEKLYTLKEEYTHELAVLGTQIETELRKIESLDNISIVSLYHKLLGNKDGVLEMLKKHYLQLSLRFNETSKALKNVVYEISILVSKIDKQNHLKEELKHKIQLFDNKLTDHNLSSYKELVLRITSKLKLVKEIEEAIDQGMVVNKKFNITLSFIKKKAQAIYDEVNDKNVMASYAISNLGRYQDLITSLRHSLVKLEIEMNDVYQEILNTKGNQNPLVSNFISEYRMNLLSDLMSTKTLNGSYVFLKNFKAIIMSTTRSLRNDLRNLKRELIDLEELEERILYELGDMDS